MDMVNRVIQPAKGGMKMGSRELQKTTVRHLCTSVSSCNVVQRRTVAARHRTSQWVQEEGYIRLQRKDIAEIHPKGPSGMLKATALAWSSCCLVLVVLNQHLPRPSLPNYPIHSPSLHHHHHRHRRYRRKR